jgi:regulator of protease activity HflC (stomatin/prohibitin superfamily)
MLDKIFEFLASFWEQVVPFAIVEQTDAGVLLRGGKFHCVVGGGFHWKIPFYDRIAQHTIVTTTLSLPAQSVVTKDAHDVVTKAVIKYKVSDIKIFLLEVYDTVDALSDMTCGIIRNIIKDNDLAACQEPDIENTITKKARIQARRFGIEIEAVTLTDFGKIRSIRLFNEQNLLN